jgi:hypothetical protein
MVTINTVFPSSYRQDQQFPFSITCSSLNRTSLWEAAGNDNEFAGALSPRAGFDTIQPYTSLAPYNRTQTLTLRVYDAARPSWTNASSWLTFDFNNDEITYPSFSGTVTYYGATGTDPCPSGDCFIETCIKGNAYNRGFGLSAPPHSYAWDSANFDYAIALGQVNAASIWVGGVSKVGAFSGVPSIQYKDGDVFRVGVENGKVCFRQNGKLIYQHTPAVAPTGLCPLVSFYDPGTKLWQTRFWQSSYGSDQRTMPVWGVLPICQDKISEHEVTEIAEVSEAEAQRGQDKVVRYHHQQDKWDLVFSARRLSELQLIRDFRAFHRLHIPFYLTDQARGLEKLVVFDTGIKDRLLQANMFDFSCTVKEY